MVCNTVTKEVAVPERRVDLDNGKVAVQQNCLSCHGADGTRTKAPDRTAADAYLYPLLTGDGSCNDDTGMRRLNTATRCIHANMPLGAQTDHPMLAVDQAYDAAALDKAKYGPSS